MRIQSLLLLSVLALPLLACASDPAPVDIVPQLTFAQLQPLPLDVGKVVINSSVPDVAGANPIRHTNIADAFKKYAEQRFVGSGGVDAGTLTITLDETSVSKGTANTDNKWTAWTHLDQVGDYKASIKVSVRYDAADGSYKTASLQQQRGMTVPERTSLAEKEKLEQKMIEGLIYDLDKQIVPALQTRLMILSAGIR